MKRLFFYITFFTLCISITTFAQEIDDSILDDVLDDDILSDLDNSQDDISNADSDDIDNINNPDNDDDSRNNPDELNDDIEDDPIENPIPPKTKSNTTSMWTIDISGTVNASYSFEDIPNKFDIIYTWTLSGSMRGKSGVIRGNAVITAEVESALATWKTGECTLNINIPTIPFEIRFTPENDTQKKLRLVFKKVINEIWESKCRYFETPDMRFDTRGEPEKWLIRAFERADPSFKSIIVTVDPDSETSAPIHINRETLDDTPLGEMEVSGKALVTITPKGSK